MDLPTEPLMEIAVSVVARRVRRVGFIVCTLLQFKFEIGCGIGAIQFALSKAAPNYAQSRVAYEQRQGGGARAGAM